MNRKDRRKWLKFVSHLKKKFPISYPVTIKTKPYNFSGECIHHFDRFGRVDRVQIVINDRLDFDGRLDTLIHEYAHALECAQFGNCDLLHEHSAVWGVNYAACYRAIEELHPWMDENNLW